MANKKVSQLTSKPAVNLTDLFLIADPTSGQAFKTTISDLGTAIGSGVSSVNGLVGAVVLDTDDIQELASPTNRWFTDTRARAALSASSPLAYNSGTGVFSLPQANGSTNGFLSSADWTTFNAKQAALSGTGFVKISGTTISYDNSTYLTTSGAASTYLALSGGTLTGALNGTSATFTGDLTLSATNPRLYLTDTDNNPDYFISNTDGTFTIYDVTNSTSRLTISTLNTILNTNLRVDGDVLIKQDSVLGGVSGYTAIASDSDGIFLKLGTASAHAYLVLSSLTSFRNFTFPDATGTIALTSNLSSYLPLTGGTLTGGLSGTTGSFSGNVSTSAQLRIEPSGNAILVIGSRSSGTPFEIYNTSNILRIYNGSIDALQIATGSGAVTLAGALTGTSATFSGDLTINNGLADGGQLVLASSGFSNWNIDNFSGRFRAYYGSTEYFTINASGYVGIGTNNPSVGLEVNGASNLTSRGRYVKTSEGILQLGANRGTSNCPYIGSENAYDFAIITNDTERMRITSGGSVYIGDIGSADGKLMVKTGGAIAYNGSSYNGVSANIRLMSGGTPVTGTTTGISFGVGGSAEAYIGAVQNSSNYADIVFQNYAGAYVERMRITSSGNVGIGTTSPSRNLDINGNLRVQSGAIDLSNDFNNQIYSLSNAFYIKTNGSEKMVVTSSGNVGIGTTAPAFSLDVLGSVPLRVVSNSSLSNSTYGASQIFRQSNTVGSGVGIAFGMWNSSNANAETAYLGTIITTNTAGSERGDLAFYTTDNGSVRNERMRIASDGWVTFQGNGNGFTIGQASGVNRIDNNGTTFRLLGTSNSFIPIAASAFNVNSDYRLKEDLKSFNNSIDIINLIKIYDFKWKNKEERNYGVIAHELQEVLPYVVYGEKDGMESNNEIKTQGVDYGKLVPILIKGIQELKAELDTLKNK